MDRSDLLDRMATLLKREIGPAVPDAYPKTQAFLGAVVLQKLAAESRLAEDHARAAGSDKAALLSDLSASVENAPEGVRQAFAAFATGGDRELCALIEAIYDARAALGADSFDRILGRIRLDLRRAIDRRMEIAA